MTGIETFDVFTSDIHGNEIEATVKVKAWFSRDTYGEDADGNRGVPVYELDRFEVLEVDKTSFCACDKGLRDLIEDAVSDKIDDVGFDISEDYE